MNKLANDAAHDLRIGHNRVAPAGRRPPSATRLYSVLRTRQRMLKRSPVEA
jgi:hypothetical protein